MESGLIALLRRDPLAFGLLAISLVIAIGLHEYAHARVADLQGDRMPRAMGRVTLNPLKHLDPLGTMAILLVGFGWGRPVEFRPEALASQRFGSALVAVAGPLMNLLLAAGGALALGAIATDRVALLLRWFVFTNLLLGFFNLLPLPPLDGSRLATAFLPARHRRLVYRADRYGFVILLGLVFFTQLAFIYPLVEGVFSLLLEVTDVG